MEKIFFNEQGFFNWISVTAVVAILGLILSWKKYQDEKRDKVESSKSERQRAKKEYLTESYKELLRIVKSFPNKTPYDVMIRMPYGPRFDLEDFDTVNRILNIQTAEDFEKQLEQEGLSYAYKEEIKTEIRNRKSYIKEITKIRDMYFKSKQEYQDFRDSDQSIELYASQEVKNCLVEFEVLWRNAFIAGRELEYRDGRGNKLDDVRWKLEQLMRADIGVQ